MELFVEGDRAEVVVVGGGTVGAALAFGMARAGRDVLVLDEGDRAFRAARGNFGLVWVQGKGIGCPAYADLSRRSAAAWAGFAALLRDLTDIDVRHRRPGGFHIVFDEAELAERADRLADLARSTREPMDFETVDRARLARELPGIGPSVAGAVWSPADGHADPLRLLHALHRGIQRLGGRIATDARVAAIRPEASGIRLETARGTVVADRVVLAAGLGNVDLGRQVGLDLAFRPVRGQILVTERVAPFLPYATNMIRQTEEGTVLIGDNAQEAGFDTATERGVVSAAAARGLSAFPHLAAARVVRAWAALRIMSPDGFPIHALSPVDPRIHAVGVHSGVTLAAFHALDLGPALAAGSHPADLLATFSPERFDVRRDTVAYRA